MTLDQPPACYAIKCPLAGKAKGFVLGAGDPGTAKFSIVLESPYREEVAWRDVSEVEFARRKQAYPGMPVEFLRRGEPVVGRSGAELFGWALKALAVRREDVFLDNTIRCAMSLKEPSYPTGAVRKRAEACCRMYDRVAEVNNLRCGVCKTRVSYEEILTDKKNVQMLQKYISPSLQLGRLRGTEAEQKKALLLAGVRRVGGLGPRTAASRVSVQEMRGVSEAFQNTVEEHQKRSTDTVAAGAVLQQELCRESSGRPSMFQLEGRSDVPGRVSHALFAKPSTQAGQSKPVCNGASVSDGTCSGALSETDRSSPPSQREQVGQPSAESRTDGAGIASREIDLSTLPEEFLHTLVCPRCGESALERGFLGLVSIHPAALTREPTPLPVQIRTFEKAIDFSRQGLRVVVLAGGKAAEWWFGAPRNPMRWIGHYEVETDATRQRREERRLEGMETKVEEKREKKSKVKKLKAKEALAMLLGKVRPGTPGLIPGVYEDYALNCTLLCSEYEEMLALVKPKKKKVS